MSNNISTMGQVIDNNARLRSIQTQLNDLQTQLSSGKKSQSLSGLGTEAISTLRARADISQIDVYQTNITTGITRSKQMLQAIKEFKAQAKTVSEAMAGETQSGEINLKNIKDFAHSALSYMRELLNSKDGDRYLFAGSDAFTKPMDDSGAHGTYMTALADNWKNGTIDTDTLISSYNTTPETTMGYSATLSSGTARNIYVRADVTTDVDYTVFADNEGFKDILNSLSLMDNLDLDKVALDDDDSAATTDTAPGLTRADQQENFFKMYENVIKTINGGIDKLDQETQRLERVELTLTNISSGHKADKSVLEGTVAGVENADPTEVAVKITALQIQLAAAYQVTARLGQLTLSSYI